MAEAAWACGGDLNLLEREGERTGMSEGSFTQEKVVIVRKPIGAIFSPGERDKSYYLGVAWWSYPAHVIGWLLFISIIVLTTWFAWKEGLDGVSIAEILMWDFSIYVIFLMAGSTRRDGRLSGWKKCNFYLSYVSACVFKAAWVAALFVLSAFWLLDGNGRFDVRLGVDYADFFLEGHWGDDVGFFAYMVFWFLMFWAFSGRSLDNE